MFCPVCKRSMHPDRPHGVWRCKGCGTTVPLGHGVEVRHSTPKAREVAVVEGARVATLPTAHEVCPKCENGTAYYVLRQTRGSDEPETRIFECTKCGHKWREYQ